MAVFVWNGWQASRGISGRLGQYYARPFVQNHFLSGNSLSSSIELSTITLKPAIYWSGLNRYVITPWFSLLSNQQPTREHFVTQGKFVQRSFLSKLPHETGYPETVVVLKQNQERFRSFIFFFFLVIILTIQIMVYRNTIAPDEQNCQTSGTIVFRVSFLSTQYNKQIEGFSFSIKMFFSTAFRWCPTTLHQIRIFYTNLRLNFIFWKPRVTVSIYIIKNGVFCY